MSTSYSPLAALFDNACRIWLSSSSYTCSLAWMLTASSESKLLSQWLQVKLPAGSSVKLSSPPSSRARGSSRATLLLPVAAGDSAEVDSLVGLLCLRRFFD